MQFAAVAASSSQNDMNKNNPMQPGAKRHNGNNMVINNKPNMNMMVNKISSFLILKSIQVTRD
jgi:hypothetical protein